MEKCLKRTKNTKNHKYTKNCNHITRWSSECGQAFRQFWAPFLYLYPIFGPKNQNFQKIIIIKKDA